VLDASPLFENRAGAQGFVPRPDDRPLTRFEKRGQRLGHEVWDLHYVRKWCRWWRPACSRASAPL